MELKTLLARSAVLYRRQFGERAHAYVVQFRGETIIERAQFLALVIEDRESKRWICLRLSTFRKIVAWLVRGAFVPTARRLYETEKSILDADWRKKHRETL